MSQYEQFDISLELIEHEFPPAIFEQRQIDRFKENYHIDYTVIDHYHYEAIIVVISIVMNPCRK